MVYIINAQDCQSGGRNLATNRNRLFTAITRSQAWVRVIGVGSDMKELMEEYGRLEEKNFELDFVYPNAEQRKQLRIVHRDMTRKVSKRLESNQRSLRSLLEDLEAGDIHVTDLEKDTLAKLKEYLA